MTPRPPHRRLIVAFGTLALAVCTVGPVARAGRDLTPFGTPPGKPAFDDKGAQIAEQLPDLPVYTPDGEAATLHDAWSGRPTLLVTSSLTCPKSRATWPQAAELAAKLKGKVNVAVVYVVEAHPKGDPSPYKGVEDVTIENQRDRILYRQPATVAERLKLANEFRRRLNVGVPVYVDAMDNAAWKNLGGGPNMGVLVDERGVVVARQGWFDGPGMEKAAAAYLESSQKAKAAERVKGGFADWDITQPVASKDLAAVKRQIEAKPELVKYVEPWSARGDMGAYSLLQLAADGGHPEIAEYLIARGAEVNYQNEHRPSALHFAAKKGDAAMVAALVKAGADVNLRAVGAGPTALQEAVIHGHRDVADLLLKAGAKPNFFTDVGLGQLDRMRPRLAADPTVAARPDGWGRTPLAYAAGNGQVDALKLLVDAGATDARGPAGERAALHWALKSKHVDAARFLLDHSGDPNGGDWYTPFLHAAAGEGDATAVRLLLAHKADLKAEDMLGHQAIHEAAVRDRADVVEALYDAGADVNAGTGAERAPCGPPDQDQPKLNRPLYLAAESGGLKAAKALLSHGADPNGRNAKAETPLHGAVHAYDPGPKQVEMLTLLLDAGADVNAKDAGGRTPLDLAVEFERAAEKSDPPTAAVIDLLKRRGGKPGADVAGPPGRPAEQAKGRELRA